MCFSATASFIASGYLATIALLCLNKNINTRTRFIAGIPLIFALQQLSEGILWLSFSHHWIALQQFMPYVFLFFALFLWPVWIPLALTAIEPSCARRHYLGLSLMTGVIVGLYLYHFLLFHGVIATPLSCHIYYDMSLPETASTVATIAYLLATVAPFFISSIPAFWFFGTLLAGSYLISYIWYLHHLISLWCFFAALLSSVLYYVLDHIKKTP